MSDCNHVNGQISCVLLRMVPGMNGHSLLSNGVRGKLVSSELAMFKRLLALNGCHAPPEWMADALLEDKYNNEVVRKKYELEPAEPASLELSAL